MEAERKPPSRGIEVNLLDHTSDPGRSLYMAFRVAYSALTPGQILARIEDERITRDQMLDFIGKRLETGHASPMEQVWFEFGISGVTRAFSHQFVRHHIGISFEQQSQRYVTFKGGEFPYTLPESIRKAGLAGEFEKRFADLAELYENLIVAGVPAEDARFVLPNATNTNFKVTVNFLELLHIADLRLCTRAQWEFRKVVALMRSEVMKVLPEFGRFIQPKCGESRMGFCDESLEDWRRCPIGEKRPHRSLLFSAYTERRDELHESLRWGRKISRRKSKETAEQGSLLGSEGLEALSFAPGDVKGFLSDDDYIEVTSLTEEDFRIIESEESST